LENTSTTLTSTMGRKDITPNDILKHPHRKTQNFPT
jgi:hypothetical protein